MERAVVVVVQAVQVAAHLAHLAHQGLQVVRAALEEALDQGLAHLDLGMYPRVLQSPRRGQVISKSAYLTTSQVNRK